MQTDSLRLVFTYLTGLVVIVGGGILLVIPSQVPSEQLLPFLTGVVGTVIGFVFNREGTTAAQRATERAFTAGVSAQPTITTSAPPPTVTVVPPEIGDEGGQG